MPSEKDTLSSVVNEWAITFASSNNSELKMPFGARFNNMIGRWSSSKVYVLL